MKDDLNYSPSDCFETFPFPSKFETQPQLEAAAKEYYEFRAALMVKNNEGLTKTYNRFHDPNEASADVMRLRELHAAMDRAVLDTYGWTDLKPTCTFLLDYEPDEDEEESVGRQRKKPWRYRWPDDFRDEVLARLLELNKKRAEQELLLGTEETKSKAKKSRKASSKKALVQRDEVLLPYEDSRARPLQLAEAVLCITLLLSTWKRKGIQRVRRDVLDAGLVLMLNPDLRQQLLGKRFSKASKPAPAAEYRFFSGLNLVLERLQLNEAVRIADIEGIPMVQLGPKAPTLEQLDAADQLRADETIQVISKLGEQPVQIFLQENVHVTYELVS